MDPVSPHLDSVDVELEVHRPITADDVALLRHLADDAAAVDAHPALGDSVWRDMADPSEASVLVVARVDREPAGALHVAPAENEPTQRTGAVVLAPDHRTVEVLAGLVDRAARTDVCGDAHHLVVWILGADDAADAVLWQVGATRARELLQMRVALPVTEEPAWPERVRVRTFEPGRDEEAWLRVNNRSFAADPDQHGWTLENIRGRERETWFDPAGFLLAVTDAGDIAGFCWTKLHPPGHPHDTEPIGEIYVIGVDPDHQGTGLGRALVVAGLASLHDRGTSVGMLFVDAANAPAVRLYRALGFDVARSDRAYARAVA
jgi:mycothiol synthase